MNYSNSLLYQAVIKQLTRMLARALDNAPAADELPMYAQVMTDDLMNCGYGDDNAAYVGGAIDQYGRTAERWPRTRDIQDVLHGIAYRRELEEENNRILLTYAKREPGPIQSIYKPSPAGKILEKLGVVQGAEKRRERPRHVLNDDEHERLINELSIEGEVYRARMGYPEPKAEGMFEDLHDKSICP